MLRPDNSARSPSVILPIAIGPASNPLEFEFARHMKARIGQSDSPLYNYAYEIATSRDSVGLNPKQETFRYHVVGKATYRLVNIATGNIAMSGSVDAFTAYSVASVDTSVTPAQGTGATIATRAAEDDAMKRLMVMLADLAVARLMAEWGRLSDETF